MQCSSVMFFFSLMMVGTAGAMSVLAAGVSGEVAAGSRGLLGGGLSITCLLCIDVVQQAKQAVKNPDLQKDVQKGFEEGVCALFPDDCQSKVVLYAPLVFDLVTKSLDPQTFCEDIGLCVDTPIPPAPVQRPQSAMTLLKSAALLSSLSMSESAPRSGGSDLNCEVCMFIVHEAVKTLTSNITEDKVLRIVDKARLALPAEMQKACWSVMQDLVVTVFQVAGDALIHPRRVCATLHFCSAYGAGLLLYETRKAAEEKQNMDKYSLHIQPEKLK
ncbi:hypothetical protein ACOMHN_041834 [Nucella lapillus]